MPTELLNSPEIIAVIIAVVFGILGYLIKRTTYDQFNEMKKDINNLIQKIDNVYDKDIEERALQTDAFSQHLIKYRHEDISMTKEICTVNQGDTMRVNHDMKVLEGKFMAFEERFEEFVERTEKSLDKFGDKVDLLSSNYNVLSKHIENITNINSLLLEQIREMKDGKR